MNCHRGGSECGYMSNRVAAIVLSQYDARQRFKVKTRSHRTEPASHESQDDDDKSSYVVETTLADKHWRSPMVINPIKNGFDVNVPQST